MTKFGIDNVRGGSFCQLNLSNEDKITIQKMISGSTDLCYKCGKSGHYINECNEILVDTEQNDQNLCNELCCWILSCFFPQYEEQENNDQQPLNQSIKLENNYNCQYCNKSFDTKKRATYHENFYCKVKIQNEKCYKCDRLGHYSKNCYTSTSLNI